MSLLHQIQESIVQEGADIGSILLQLRLLASRLGSDVLEEWVKHESEGYPEDVAVPSYRITEIIYQGTFSGPLGSGWENAPIPTALVEKYAGKQWTKYEVRESIAGVCELVKVSAETGLLRINASNLILLLQGKIYPDYACNDISATITRAAMTAIQQSVRSRILELTLELEKPIPEASLVTFGAPQDTEADAEKVQKVQQLFQQIIIGNVTTAVAGLQDIKVAVKINTRDSGSFIKYLTESGIPETDASKLAEILKSEEPHSPEEPFGKRAQQWLLSNLKKAAKGTWKVGMTVAMQVIIEAVLAYYGLK